MTEDQNLTMTAGDDATLAVTVASGVTITSATALDFEVDDLDGTVLISKTLGSGVVATSATVATVTLAAANTADITPASYPWALRITNSSGLKHTVTTGLLTILKSVVGGAA